MNLGFVILYVRDMDRAKAFYTEALGLTVLEAVSGPTFVTLRPAGGSLLALQDKTASRLPPGQAKEPGGVEVSFEVDDVDATWKRWKEKGVEMVTDPMDMPFGRYFMAKDPEGYCLSVYRLNPQLAKASES
jgi:predicted enzyme related to lactoylglutathione lyase